jgi:signal transduction histidine kinase
VKVEHPTVLVISDDPRFSRTITTRWQREPSVPAFTMLSGDLWPRTVEGFDIAIVGALRPELLSMILEPLHSTKQPLFCVCEDESSAQTIRKRWPRTGVIRSDEPWLEGLILAAGEAIHRSLAEARVRVAEEDCSSLRGQAMLGRYMLEMRHGLNNALTSLLGNSDLLLIERAELPPQAREQIETIRDMTLRIHEVMQRFSSLEKEMNVAEQQAERKSGKWRVAAAGAQ